MARALAAVVLLWIVTALAAAAITNGYEFGPHPAPMAPHTVPAAPLTLPVPVPTPAGA